MSPMKICIRCGSTWEEYMSRGVLGCTDCYSLFSEELKHHLVSYHGRLRHRGSVPDQEENDEIQQLEQVARLRERLSDAVRSENFEEALQLQRHIQQIKEKNTEEESPGRTG